MKHSLAKLASASVLSLCTAASALANSVTQPGETVGIAVGAPLAPGFYLIDTTDTGCRDSDPESCLAITIPVGIWSTGWTIFGGRLQFVAATPILEVDVENTSFAAGWYNPLLAGQVAWDLGNGWGFSYLLGAYFDVDSPVAWSSTSLNQRFGLSYTDDGWNLTANVIWGIQFDQVTNEPQISPCPASTAFPSRGCNPNFINLDLTATKKFGKWEVGGVSYFSADLSEPVAGYQKQSQLAVGGLVGYDFGPVNLQAYLTTDLYEENYGGRDTRVWGRVVIPLRH